MRTTFSEIHLFNDDLFCAWYIFIFNRKGWAESKLVERQKERGRETKHSYERVAAWAINLTIEQIFITARERIILDLIKTNIKIIFKNLDGYLSLGAVPFHPAIKLLKYTTIGPWDCSETLDLDGSAHWSFIWNGKMFCRALAKKHWTHIEEYKFQYQKVLSEHLRGFPETLDLEEWVNNNFLCRLKRLFRNNRFR